MNHKILKPILLLLVWTCLLPNPLWGVEVWLSDTEPRQGDVVRVTVESAGVCSVKGTWNEHSFDFAESEKQDDLYWGLIGIDLSTRSGTHRLTVHTSDCPGAQRAETKLIPLFIHNRSFRTQELTIPDEDKVHLSPENLRRVRREKQAIRAVLSRDDAPPLSRPPFANPVNNYQPGKSFGSRRIINGSARSPHSGEDYSAGVGDPIYGIAGGAVSLVGDFFFAGKSVFIDHGAGLHSMYFHLSDYQVEEGEQVEAGQVIGKAGMSGRVTGPHLHLGVKLLGATVDPDSLLQLKRH